MKPIVGPSGKVYDELPIPAGTSVVVFTFKHDQHVTATFPSTIPSSHSSFTIPCTASRDTGLLGPDAYELRPECWFGVNEILVSPVGDVWEL